MSRYRKISIRMWGDEKFKDLTQPQPNAQTLWVYLLTGPHTTTLPGAFSIGEAGLAENLGWPLKALRKAFEELLAKGMAQADWVSRLVFIPKALIHNPPESPNVVKAWRSYFEELPDCPLKALIFAHYETTLIGSFAEAFAKAFPEGYKKDFAEAIAKDYGESGTGTGTGTGTEQEQENPPTPFLAFGEFGRAKLTTDQHGKLKAKLNGNLDDFIAQFDRWVNEAPDASHAGVKRKDRHAYESILAWFDKAVKEGKIRPRAVGAIQRGNGVVL